MIFSCLIFPIYRTFVLLKPLICPVGAGKEPALSLFNLLPKDWQVRLFARAFGFLLDPKCATRALP